MLASVVARHGTLLTSQRTPSVLITKTQARNIGLCAALQKISNHHHSATSSALINEDAPGQDDNVMMQASSEPSHNLRRFYGCYLLASQCPKAKGRTYIG